MQASSDILLGWLRGVGPDGREGDYYVRQLRDWKQAANVESMDAHLLADYGRSCAHVLARAHARTGDRIAIAGYLGSGEVADIAFTRFAEAYARQNERDYAALREAVASGSRRRTALTFVDSYSAPSSFVSSSSNYALTYRILSSAFSRRSSSCPTMSSAT
jgi:hypothetical protein